MKVAQEYVVATKNATTDPIGAIAVALYTRAKRAPSEASAYVVFLVTAV